MSGLLLIAIAAMSLGLVALACLLWALSSGQYDDPDGAAARILMKDDDEV
jgi:cbb3-type cytochrome oxidase maturation protein